MRWPEHLFALIIAKGLSREMIDLLGVKYELEPEFLPRTWKGQNLSAWVIGNLQL